MTTFATDADLRAIEAEKPLADQGLARSIYEYLTRARAAHMRSLPTTMPTRQPAMA